MKIVAQQISDRDNSVRSAALNTLVLGHSIIGEPIYKYIGRVCVLITNILCESFARIQSHCSFLLNAIISRIIYHN